MMKSMDKKAMATRTLIIVIISVIIAFLAVGGLIKLLLGVIPSS
jgi:hypothetical protein